MQSKKRPPTMVAIGAVLDGCQSRSGGIYSPDIGLVSIVMKTNGEQMGSGRKNSTLIMSMGKRNKNAPK